jgi:hypothetical protein
MAFELESNYKPGGDQAQATAKLVWSRGAGRTALGVTAALCLMTSCLAMTPKPKGYRPTGSHSRLVVNEGFSFTTVTGLAKMKLTVSIPSGVYSECAADDDGAYYLSPTGRIGVKSLFPDSLTGGIYRRNSSPPAYFIFSAPGAHATEMELLTRGQFPQMLNEIPPEFSKVIKIEK